jgi:DNA-binding LacI/PurR family transcriptional regulator
MQWIETVLWGTPVPATIRDVARHAGVSLSTVSYVLSGNRPVSAGTRERVEDSIRKLKFEPHAGARSIRASRTGVIGLVVPFRQGINSAVRMEFISSITEAANAQDLDVLLMTAERGNGRIERAVRSAMVDGLIAMEICLDDQRIPLLVELAKPAVLIGMPDQAWGLPYVDLDQEAAGRTCAEHLLGLGHTSIGLLGCSPAFYDNRLAFVHRFRDGVFEVLREARLPAPFEPIEPTRSGVEDALRRLITKAPDLTGLIVDNNMALTTVIETLKRSFRRGRSGLPQLVPEPRPGAHDVIPRDLSVVANCPDELARHQPIALTHVPLPSAELGRLAVQLLVRRTRGERVESVLLAPELREAASTAQFTPPLSRLR